MTYGRGRVDRAGATLLLPTRHLFGSTSTSLPITINRPTSISFRLTFQLANYPGHPDVNPDGTAPVKEDAPKLAIRTLFATPLAPPKTINGTIVPAGIVAPPVLVAGSKKRPVPVPTAVILKLSFQLSLQDEIAITKVSSGLTPTLEPIANPVLLPPLQMLPRPYTTTPVVALPPIFT